MYKKYFTEGFHWPIKEIESCGVIKYLIESMKVNGEKIYNSPRSYKPDPPDCIAEDGEGNQVGFEVTALVDQEEVKERVKGNLVYRDWTPGEIIQEIQKKLNEKDQKIFHGGPYSKKIVVLHTHSIIIEQECLKTIEEHFFNPLKQLNEAYLLLWYNAAIQRCQYIKLKFRG